MNIKYEFQLSPGYRPLPQPHPRCTRCSDCLDRPWTWLIALPLPDQPWTIQGTCAATTLLSASGQGGWHPATDIPAHHAQLAACLPSSWSLARALTGQCGKGCTSAGIATSFGTPEIRCPLSGLFPDYGTENLTFGERVTLQPGFVSVCQQVFGIKEITSNIFDTKKESLLHKQKQSQAFKEIYSCHNRALGSSLSLVTKTIQSMTPNAELTPTAPSHLSAPPPK